MEHPKKKTPGNRAPSQLNAMIINAEEELPKMKKWHTKIGNTHVLSFKKYYHSIVKSNIQILE